MNMNNNGRQMRVQQIVREADQPFSHNLLVFLLHNKLHLGSTSLANIYF